MSRVYGTVSMGLRAPIIRQGDDLVEIVTGAVVEAINEGDSIIQEIKSGKRKGYTNMEDLITSLNKD